MQSEQGRTRSPDYETIEAAALRLSTTPKALRARCRRGLTKKGDVLLAALGGGVVAFKFGRSWRVSFPEAL